MVNIYDYNSQEDLNNFFSFSRIHNKQSGDEFIKNNNLFLNLDSFIHNLDIYIKYSLGESSQYMNYNDIHNIKKAFDLSYSHPLYLNDNMYVYRCYQKDISHSMIRKQKKNGRFLSTSLDLKISSMLCHNEFNKKKKKESSLLDIGQQVFFSYDSKKYVGIVINKNSSHVKFHLCKIFSKKIKKLVDNVSIMTSSIIIPLKSLTILDINQSLNICIKLEKKSSGILPVLFYSKNSSNYKSYNSIALCDDFSKSESPKDHYKEILLDYKGNLVPLYEKNPKDSLFGTPDILIHNDCPVFKYQDRYHNTNFNSKTIKKARIASIKKIRSDYYHLKTIQKYFLSNKGIKNIMN